MARHGKANELRAALKYKKMSQKQKKEAKASFEGTKRILFNLACEKELKPRAQTHVIGNENVFELVTEKNRFVIFNDPEGYVLQIDSGEVHQFRKKSMLLYFFKKLWA